MFSQYERVTARLGAARVGDERDRVGALEHDPAGRLVHHLAGTVNSFSFTFAPEAVRKNTGIRSKNRVRSSFVSSVMRRPRTFGIDLLEELLEVGRLPGQRGAVIDDLDRELALLGVDLGHARRRV